MVAVPDRKSKNTRPPGGMEVQVDFKLVQSRDTDGRLAGITIRTRGRARCG